MKMRILTLTILVPMLVGCGTSKKTSRSRTPQHQQTEQPSAPARILYPEGHEQYVEDKESARQQSAATTDSRRSVEKRSDRPTMKFTMRESADVRVPGINPLPAGGILELDLDRLKDEFCYPVRGRLLSPYGMRGNSMHTGIDIKAYAGDTIRAALPGVVRLSKMYSSYGNVVVIRHYEGFETLYSHNTRNLVQVNDEVEAGDPIALAGRTGRATGDHLHFEVRVGSSCVDPVKFVDPEKMTLRSGTFYARSFDGTMVAYNSPAEFEKMQENARVMAVTNQRAADATAQQGTPAYRPDPNKVKEQYHVVQQGETLSAIARKYSTTVKKICDLNNITNPDRLRLNQRLRVK